MKNILNKLSVFLLTLLMLVGTSCELDEFVQDPNNLSLDAADIDLVLNSAEFGMKDWFYEVTDPTMEVSRLVAAEPVGITYFNFAQPTRTDNLWELANTSILPDAASVITLSEEDGLAVHAGIAKVLQAYVLMVSVDIYGDVPYYQDDRDASVLEPESETGSSIYTEAENLLNAAIEDFATDVSAIPGNDLFYGGDAETWTKLANTLLLRLYLTTSRVQDNAAQINALLSEDNFIGPGEDWVFQHGTNAASPDSRHEYYIDNYVTGASDYQSDYLMYLMYTEKTNIDPRIRYYFYRQTNTPTEDVNERDCISDNRPPHYPDGMPFCFDGLGGVGYWGRDHLDADGIPPDNLLRTNFGVYPVGGRFDDGVFDPEPAEGDVTNEGVTVGDGLGGAGIHPLMMSFYKDFMIAEAELMINNDAGAARTALENGVRGSISAVLDFGSSLAPANLVPTGDEIDAYVDEVLARYDATASDMGKLDVIGKEYFIALFGNGIEAYNLYRRTGAPSDVQLPLDPNTTGYINSFFYPSALADRNGNVNQKADVSGKVFWAPEEGALIEPLR